MFPSCGAEGSDRSAAVISGRAGRRFGRGVPRTNAAAALMGETRPPVPDSGGSPFIRSAALEWAGSSPPGGRADTTLPTPPAEYRRRDRDHDGIGATQAEEQRARRLSHRDGGADSQDASDEQHPADLPGGVALAVRGASSLAWPPHRPCPYRRLRLWAYSIAGRRPALLSRIPGHRAPVNEGYA